MLGIIGAAGAGWMFEVLAMLIEEQMEDFVRGRLQFC